MKQHTVKIALVDGGPRRPASYDEYQAAHHLVFVITVVDFGCKRALCHRLIVLH